MKPLCSKKETRVDNEKDRQTCRGGGGEKAAIAERQRDKKRNTERERQRERDTHRDKRVTTRKRERGRKEGRNRKLSPSK